MRIKNNTHYLTSDLQRIFSACVNELRKLEGSRVSGLRISVIDHGHGANWIGGYAYYDSKTLTIKMPKRVKRNLETGLLEAIKTDRDFPDWIDKKPVRPARIADVFIHEVGHCLGAHHRHGDTIERVYTGWIDGEFTTEKYPVRLKSEMAIPKDPVDAKMVKLERAKSNLKTAVTRAKRATTILKKWQRKVRYYENQIAKAAQRSHE